MKKLFNISGLLLLYCLLTAKSCVNGEENRAAREQANVTVARDSIREAISTDSLSEKTLRAFEGLAVQKLLDFSDYLEVLSDTTLDPAFRQKAARMVRGMFSTDSVRLNLSAGTGTGWNAGSVALLVSSPPAGKHPEFSSVHVLHPLHRVDGNTYSGQLACTAAWLPGKTGHGHIIQSALKTADFSVMRSQTILGRDTLNPWKVLLGDVH